MTGDSILEGKERNLGGFSVHRVLPASHRRSVGPFVFFDHLGPMTLDDSHALDVRPHPHIGLSTVTYLFEGKGLHRDSLGNRQLIEPGDVNLMTAGSGIVHSERSPLEERIANGAHRIHGLQFWLALPREKEDCAPCFDHYSSARLPDIALAKGIRGKLLIGEHGGAASPVATQSPTFFLVIEAGEAGKISVSLPEGEFGAFVACGSAVVNGQNLAREELLVTSGSRELQMTVAKGARMAVFGGAPLPEPRFMWWNFVSTSSEKIRNAALRWKNQEMGKVPDEADFIPLPDDPLPR